MIKTMTAYTSEVDDEDIAIEEICSQLDLDGLKKNTIGIVACHYEFIHSGVFKAVCDALPFSITGTISSGQAGPDTADALVLTLTVMTSDDVQFEHIITPSLLNEPAKVISDSYAAAVKENNEKNKKPALILTFAPFILQNCGDEYVNVITEVSGGVPCFGTLAVDDTLDFVNCFMLANGEHYTDRMSLILIYGDVTPKFFIAHISESRLLDKSAVVTKSEGHVLMEVNDRPIINYLEDLGLVEASESQYAMSTVPFLLDYEDGTPRVSKVFIMLTPEKYALCAGAMPEGSTLYMTVTNKDDVILTTGEAVDTILKECGGASLLLAYSCICRSITLGSDQFKELELLREKVGLTLPFMMANSGGEICPTQLSDNKAINRFHNNAFIACLI